MFISYVTFYVFYKRFMLLHSKIFNPLFKADFFSLFIVLPKSISVGFCMHPKVYSFDNTRFAFVLGIIKNSFVFFHLLFFEQPSSLSALLTNFLLCLMVFKEKVSIENFSIKPKLLVEMLVTGPLMALFFRQLKVANLQIYKFGEQIAFNPYLEIDFLEKLGLYCFCRKPKTQSESFY